MVASTFLFAALAVEAADPPPGLLKKIAAREAESARARQNYTYRQSVTIQEFNDHGLVTGQYREVRDVTFSPNRIRYEQVLEQPQNTLTRIKLTPEDFADIRNIDPFLLTTEKVPLYEGQYKGEETIDGEKCFVEYIRPRQILSTQRFFEGTLWVRESDLTVVRSEGQAVPQIETLREQNLFPHFTTLRRQVDGKWFFPTETYADDTLFFRDWPQRIRIIVRYMDYKRFGAESTITFGDEPQPQK
ncbi:MAG: hypothetical protein JO097_13995 [Acidobacteriaceae bacterium]|nr:hypothetical protein [Acidobacteriaceae bacterium]MBV9294949.1 hypothetical protein [Acidobacteriaceae bacterium]MBV9763953.1 hypothetical protein [Acidobacteriaceae bacterium]